MKVAIIMGSNSDWPVLEPAEKTLKSFGVEVEVIKNLMESDITVDLASILVFICNSFYSVDILGR